MPPRPRPTEIPARVPIYADSNRVISVLRKALTGADVSRYASVPRFNLLLEWYPSSERDRHVGALLLRTGLNPEGRVYTFGQISDIVGLSLPSVKALMSQRPRGVFARLRTAHDLMGGRLQHNELHCIGLSYDIWGPCVRSGVRTLNDLHVRGSDFDSIKGLAKKDYPALDRALREYRAITR